MVRLLHPGSVDRSADEPRSGRHYRWFGESARRNIRFFPVGGTITFDSDSTVWHTQPENDVPEGQFDFYTAALHELAHALGFGTSDSWLQQVVDGKLDGRYSSMGYGADAVPLHAAGEGALFSHWMDGLRSAGLVDLSWQPTTMGPYLSHGAQRRLTYLDALGLADVGWSVRLPSLPDGEESRGAFTRFLGEVRLREATGIPMEGDACSHVTTSLPSNLPARLLARTPYRFMRTPNFI